MFKGLFDFKGQTLQIRWSIIGPTILFIFLGLISLSSTSNLTQLNATFYKQFIWFFLGSFILGALGFIEAAPATALNLPSLV